MLILNNLRHTRHFEHVSSKTQKDIAKHQANASFLWIRYWCVQCVDEKTSVPSFIRDESIFDIFFKKIIYEYHTSSLQDNLSTFTTRLNDMTFSITEYQFKKK